MTIEFVDAFLKELADDARDYQREGGSILFTRHGKDCDLNIRDVSGIGFVAAGSMQGQELPEAPLDQFVQASLLDLPRLATQVVRTLKRAAETRPAAYTDGKATVQSDIGLNKWNGTEAELLLFLKSQVLGSTRLIQLMAAAGQGKTVLLEQVAMATAARYRPDPYPEPFVLLVDLLGRYVGTIDDAIAGSLNNTYMCPGLTRRDVALCIQRNWLVLALDGFDELVARIGPRDAFLRISELIDQLKGAGTVLLSARETFFESYQIAAASRSYLQPRVGGFELSEIKLLPWTEEEGVRVFASLGSKTPDADLDSLLSTFDEDRAIVLQPFFLTRLANLWQKGERFESGPSGGDPHSRTEYIITTYIQREMSDKWVDREGRPLLDVDGHTALLSGLAEEMWRSGAFRLGVEEVQLAAELALDRLGLPMATREKVVTRAATHAALMPKEGGFAFVHDRFFYYYLSRRIVALLVSGDSANLRALLEPKELVSDVVVWLNWLIVRDGQSVQPVLSTVLELAKLQSPLKLLETNVAHLLGIMLTRSEEPVTLDDIVFAGDDLRGGRYRKLTFQRCKLWEIDLSGTALEECSFMSCDISSMRIDTATRFTGTKFYNSIIRAVDVMGERILFDPDEFWQLLRSRGGSHQAIEDVEERAALAKRVNPSVVDFVAWLIRRTRRASDIAMDEIEPEFGHAKRVVKIGLEKGVWKEHEKTTRGPRRTFIRFAVDKQLLLRGQAELVGDIRVDGFWEGLAKSFPRGGS